MHDNEKLLRQLRHLDDVCLGVRRQRFCSFDRLYPYAYQISAYCGEKKAVTDIELHMMSSRSSITYTCPSCGRTAGILGSGWHVVSTQTGFRSDDKDSIIQFDYAFDMVCWTSQKRMITSKFTAQVKLDLQSKKATVDYKPSRSGAVRHRSFSFEELATMTAYASELMPLPGRASSSLSRKARPNTLRPREAFLSNLTAWYNERQEYEEFKLGAHTGEFTSLKFVMTILAISNPSFVHFIKEYGLSHDNLSKLWYALVKSKLFSSIIYSKIWGANDILNELAGFSVSKPLRKKLREIGGEALLNTQWIREFAGEKTQVSFLLTSDKKRAQAAYEAESLAQELLRLSPSSAVALERAVSLLLADHLSSRPLAWMLRDTLNMAQRMNIKVRYKDVNSGGKIRYMHDVLTDQYHLYKAEYDEKMFAQRAQEMAPLETEGKELRIVAPKTSADVAKEGRVMRHCVASYIPRIIDGRCYIFSTQTKDGERVGTIEVNPSMKAVVQLRAYRNARVEKSVEDFVKKWAKKHDLAFKA